MAPAPAAFLRSAGLLLVAVCLLNGSNYLFHVVVSRLLGPADYGGLAALLAILMVLSAPLGVLQTVVAQRTAILVATSRQDDVPFFAAGLLRTLLPFALGSGTLVLVAAPAAASFLHLDLASAALLAPYIAFSVLASAPLNGVLQGQSRFGAMAIVVLAGVAIRLGVGLGLVAAGLGIAGAVLGTAMAAAASVLLAPPLLRIRLEVWRRARKTLDHVRGGFFTTLLALTTFWLFAEVDIALARHYLDERAAGLYSAAGLFARALLFVPSAISIVAFPRFVAARTRGDDQSRWLGLSLAAVVGLTLPALPIVILLREQLVALAFGERFVEAAGLVPILAVAMVLMAIVSLLTYFHIAVGSRPYWLLLPIVACEAALIVAFHSTGEELATIVLLASALAAAVLYQAARSVARWRPAMESRTNEVARAERGIAAEELELSVVVPCHNAGTSLADFLRDVVAELVDVRSYEVIVVSDGSTDATVEVAREFASSARVRVIDHPQRGGKGHAVRLGLAEARGEYVAFLDGDGDIKPEALRHFLAIMKLYEPDVVLGSKRHPLSQVSYPRARRLMSWTYHKLSRVLFRIDVRDTQTGVKLIRREALAAVLPRLLEKRYAFDLEFLVVARSLGFRRVFEAPVRIDYRFSSQVNAGSAVRILLDTLAIFYRHHILNTYRAGDRPPPTLDLAPGAPLDAATQSVVPGFGGEKAR